VTCPVRGIVTACNGEPRGSPYPSIRGMAVPLVGWVAWWWRCGVGYSASRMMFSPFLLRVHRRFCFVDSLLSSRMLMLGM
jgi:hypothetical protein